MTDAPVTWIGTSWKMNKTLAEADRFVAALKASDYTHCEEAQLFVIPPFTALHRVADALNETDIIVGAQNAHWKDAGAWTGEISPAQVKDCAASLVEIGHSERREHFGETDETVALKTEAAVRHGVLGVLRGRTRRARVAQQLRMERGEEPAEVRFRRIVGGRGGRREGHEGPPHLDGEKNM